MDSVRLIKASALMYLFPLALMLLFGSLAQFLAGTEVLIIAFSFVGILVGFLGARLLSQQLETRCQYKPVLLRILLNDTRVVE